MEGFDSATSSSIALHRQHDILTQQSWLPRDLIKEPSTLTTAASILMKPLLANIRYNSQPALSPKYTDRTPLGHVHSRVKFSATQPRQKVDSI
jgi:hypothetical protein